MKITRKHLKELIINEIKNHDFNYDHHRQVCDEETLDLKGSIEENFEIINDQNSINEIELKIRELKTISNEIKRMKQLVDFRSPLLSKDNF